jgi:hypothetical protein
MSVEKVHDDLMAAAATRAATLVVPRESSGPLEKHLEEALVAALIDKGVTPAAITPRTKRIAHDWDPRPGGIDLYAESADEALAAELKVDHIDQTLWDLYKMISALKLPGVGAAYLFVVAKASVFRKKKNCSGLFDLASERTLESLELFRRNAKAWCGLLAGGRGRPTIIPKSVSSRPVACEALASWHGYELRVVGVRPAGEGKISFGNDGWPIGLEPADKDCSKTSVPEPIDCKGLRIPSRFPPSRSRTDSWLAENVPQMNVEQYDWFEDVLRGRGWREDELDDRVRPYRPVP